MVIANNLGLILYNSSGSRPSAAATGTAGDVRLPVMFALVLAAAQYVLLLRRADVCRKHRHKMTVGNR
jgi:hypothetical protein